MGGDFGRGGLCGAGEIVCWEGLGGRVGLSKGSWTRPALGLGVGLGLEVGLGLCDGETEAEEEAEEGRGRAIGQGTGDPSVDTTCDQWQLYYIPQWYTCGTTVDQPRVDRHRALAQV